MRLAFLHVDLPPEGIGGVAYQVDLLAREMASRHELTVFTTTSGKAKRDYEVVVCGPRHLGPATRTIGMGLGFADLDLRKFDVVHAHGDSWAITHRRRVRTFYGTAAAEARVARSMKRCASQTVQYGMELIACARSEMRVAISENTVRYLPRIDRVIPCGVDLGTFHPGGERFERPTVLFVAGRLGGRKRGRIALKAFDAVREYNRDARMIVVSRDTVEQPGVECRSAISNEEMGVLFRRSWVLLSTSSYEGFGLPYAEALASELPVVTTRNPGAQEMLREGGGAIVRMGDLADVLGQHLRAPRRPDSCAAERIRSRVGIARVADQYDGVYGQLVCSRSTGRA